MRRIFVIARQDFRALLRDGRLVSAATLVLALLCGALLLGFLRARADEDERRELTGAFHSEWLAQEAKNPHSAAHFGTWVFRPVGALAGIDPGVERFVGGATFVEGHVRNDPRFRPADLRTGLALLPDLSAATILGLVVPLVGLLLSCGALAGERETGVLRHMLSTGVRAHELALGKLLGVLVGVFVLLAPSLVTGALALALWSASGGTTELGTRTLGLGLAYGLHTATWCALGLVCSAVCRTSRAALGAALVLWSGAVFLVPRLAAEFAELEHPLPSEVAFQKENRRLRDEGIDGHDPASERAQAFEREVLASYGVESVEDLPVNLDGLRMQADEEYGSKVFAQTYGELWDALSGQARAQLRFSWCSPLLALQPASMALCGTDLAAQRAFADAVESYRVELMGVLNGDMAANSRTGDWDYEVERDFWARTPRFEWSPPGLDTRTLGAGLAILAAWCLAASAGAVLLAARIRP